MQNELKVNQIKRGQIINVNFGECKGSVQSGVRPAVIIQNNTGNKFSPTTIVVPLTTKTKKKMPTHYKLQMDKYGFLLKDSVVLGEQIITISKNQIIDIVGEVDVIDEREIFRKVAKSIGITLPAV
ncbi:type II toxin-antitoxin system PemK/MazF family toxin [Clostridium paridis]|uniref:Type II toxin-antitoxin system PemK/MazF family toxin n=1 Tax=Clostridium paridis TaxID=2803863 RepID=A0A937FGG8_9CLOT|nr:type II toxin-antitoxin system PemK/MazF family toxin [Clostridium paridis]MBL4931578.1 type II toxin-antitoxin system PemK/MazF family toxin [Clostridium paridis]